MKKIIFAIFALAFVFAGCSKQDYNPVQAGDGMVFRAGIEIVRTSLTAADKVAWTENDLVSINGIVFKALPDAQDPTLATFVKNDSQDPDPQPVSGLFHAYYPASLQADGTAALPRTQSYVSEGSLSGVNPMYAETEDDFLSFKNICGLLEITVNGEGAVGSIAVSDAAQGLSGDFDVVENAAVLSSAAVQKMSDVVLDCGEGVQLSDGAVFYVAVPKGEYSSLCVRIYDTDGKVFVKNMKPQVSASISRSTIYPLSFDAVFGEPEPLAGVFSVGESKAVMFSAGNLTKDGEKLSIAVNQYDSEESGLLPWSAGWGESYCNANSLPSTGWNTLTSKEWDYLLNTRSVSGSVRYTNTVAEPVTIDGVACAGLFIYPDNYTGSAVDGTFSWNRITRSGIVFLPAAGRSVNNETAGLKRYGYYWAKDSINGLISYDIAFSSAATNSFNAFGNYAGYSVRLVTEAK